VTDDVIDPPTAPEPQQVDSESHPRIYTGDSYLDWLEADCDYQNQYWSEHPDELEALNEEVYGKVYTRDGDPRFTLPPFGPVKYSEIMTQIGNTSSKPGSLIGSQAAWDRVQKPWGNAKPHKYSDWKGMSWGCPRQFSRDGSGASTLHWDWRFDGSKIASHNFSVGGQPGAGDTKFGFTKPSSGYTGAPGAVAMNGYFLGDANARYKLEVPIQQFLCYSASSSQSNAITLNHTHGACMIVGFSGGYIAGGRLDMTSPKPLAPNSNQYNRNLVFTQEFTVSASHPHIVLNLYFWTPGTRADWGEVNMLSPKCTRIG